MEIIAFWFYTVLLLHVISNIISSIMGDDR